MTAPNDSTPPPSRAGRGWSWGKTLMAGGAGLVLAWGLWGLRPAVPAGRTPMEGVEGGERDSARMSEVGGARPRPFQRSGAVSAEPIRLPWQARIHTNGVLDVDRIQEDSAYRRQVIQHDRLKTLLRSPARDTPECDAVIAFVDRKGLPLAAAVDFYNVLWSTRQHEQRMSEAATPADREPIDVVRDLELSDFQRRFQADYDVEVGPMLEELLQLPVSPSVFMGVPMRSFQPGEALLSDTR